MKHGSGGLPDTKGEGTSDVDVCVFSKNYDSLSKYFPADTEIDSNSPGRVIYKLKGYPREVNVYCTDGDWWQNGYRHRMTELALKQHFPALATEAFELKKAHGTSTEETWAHILGLGENYYDELLDTQKILQIAETVNKQHVG
jgi:hypothetical protein